MKKFLVFVLIAIIIISVMDIEPTCAAGSVRVTVSGLEKMKVGQSATFSIRIDFTDCLEIEAEIYLQPSSCLSGGENWRWNSSSGKNESGYIEDSITVKAVGAGEGVVTANVVATYYFPEGGVGESRSFDNVLVRVSAPATPAPTAAPTAPPVPGATAAPTAKPGSSSQNKNPTPTPNANELKDWNQVEYMMSHSGGKDISFDMGKNKHEIPRSVLALLKGQSSCLTVNFGEYECMLDGSKIEDLDKKLKNLDLSFNTKNNKTLSTLLGGVDAFQFHFNHDSSQIPCPITYKVLADGYKSGDELYLYYHDEEEKCLEAISRHTVDKDGYVSFAVPHFSSYALAAELIDTAENNSVFYTPTPVPTDTPEPTDTPSPTPTEKPTVAPSLTPEPLPTQKADDKSPINSLLIVLIIGVLLSAVFFVAVLLWYGKDKKAK